MQALRRAPSQSATGRQGSCSAEACAVSELESRSCAHPLCGMRVATCSFVCKHCGREFCEGHRAPGVGHACAAADNADRRALVCEVCGALVIEHEVLAAAGSLERGAFEQLAQQTKTAREQVLASVRERMNKTAEMRANLHSFFAVADGLDEADAEALVSPTIRQHWQGLEREKTAHLMSLHRTRCCSGAQRSSPSRAPASHKRSRCGMKRCKTKCSAPFLQQCKKCNALFCLPHRLPEVHECGLN